MSDVAERDRAPQMPEQDSGGQPMGSERRCRAPPLRASARASCSHVDNKRPFLVQEAGALGAEADNELAGGSALRNRRPGGRLLSEWICSI
jgi:hypothetical protein